MYIPKYFEETRTNVLHDLIRAHPLGTLVVQTPDGLDANHLPFEIAPEPAPLGILRGHVARANPVWRDHSPDVDAIAVFHGPNAYISPSWYPSKKESEKVVPTWNYIVVHAYGRLRVVDDPVWLPRHIEKLTERYEAGRTQPWKVSDAPAEFIQKMLLGIVGLEISITRLVGKWKLGQHRSLADQNGVVEGLRREPTDSARQLAAVAAQFIGNAS